MKPTNLRRRIQRLERISPEQQEPIVLIVMRILRPVRNAGGLPDAEP
jgi:hypothetical protein